MCQIVSYNKSIVQRVNDPFVISKMLELQEQIKQIKEWSAYKGIDHK